MSGDGAAGVTFPVAADGRRSTSALGRAVVADALGRVDPADAVAHAVRAYVGAHRFGLEVFEPATTKTLMAALLVHDLHAGGSGQEQAHPWQEEAHAAAHGGMWRVPYAPRTALGLAALLGYGAARNRT